MIRREYSMEDKIEPRAVETPDLSRKLAKADHAFSSMFDGPYGSDMGQYYSPLGAVVGGGSGSSIERYWQNQGLAPVKLLLPKDYQGILQLCYDFYQRGGVVGTVVNRLAEFTITDIRNAQRNGTDESNAYFNAVLHEKPSRLMRLLRTFALEYFVSGMIIPRVDWVEMLGKDISADSDLKPGKKYMMPQFDWYPPALIDIQWAGWGKKTFYLKIPSSDMKLIKNQGSNIKDQQLRYEMLVRNYPDWVTLIGQGINRVELTDVDPILRKELSITPYPTPYLFNVLESVLYKQQLRRMDYAVAARVINAILLVQEGDKDFPLTQDNQDNLTTLKQQIMARTNDPRLMERLFILFSNHTTKLTWIHPDTSAMLSQEKYQLVNSDIEESLGFARILLTGQARSAGTSAEVSTWAIQPAMEEFRAALIEWITDVYQQGAQLNGFRNLPVPLFKPIRLQDHLKTAAIFAQAYKEGIVSRTTRAESVGVDYETETELMRDEAVYAKDLPAYQPLPYAALPPMMGKPTGTAPTGSPSAPPSGGRPIGSQNVPINQRNTGVRPPGQEPQSQLKAEDLGMSDEALLEKLSAFAESRGIVVTPEMVLETPPLIPDKEN